MNRFQPLLRGTSPRRHGMVIQEIQMLNDRMMDGGASSAVLTDAEKLCVPSVVSTVVGLLQSSATTAAQADFAKTLLRTLMNSPQTPLVYKALLDIAKSKSNKSRSSAKHAATLLIESILDDGEGTGATWLLNNGALTACLAFCTAVANEQSEYLLVDSFPALALLHLVLHSQPQDEENSEKIVIDPNVLFDGLSSISRLLLHPNTRELSLHVIQRLLPLLPDKFFKQIEVIVRPLVELLATATQCLQVDSELAVLSATIFREARLVRSSEAELKVLVRICEQDPGKCLTAMHCLYSLVVDNVAVADANFALLIELDLIERLIALHEHRDTHREVSVRIQNCLAQKAVKMGGFHNAILRRVPDLRNILRAANYSSPNFDHEWNESVKAAERLNKVSLRARVDCAVRTRAYVRVCTETLFGILVALLANVSWAYNDSYSKKNDPIRADTLLHDDLNKLKSDCQATEENATRFRQLVVPTLKSYLVEWCSHAIKTPTAEAAGLPMRYEGLGDGVDIAALRIADFCRTAMPESTEELVEMLESEPTPAEWDTERAVEPKWAVLRKHLLSVIRRRVAETIGAQLYGNVYLGVTDPAQRVVCGHKIFDAKEKRSDEGNVSLPHLNIQNVAVAHVPRKQFSFPPCQVCGVATSQQEHCHLCGRTTCSTCGKDKRGRVYRIVFTGTGQHKSCIDCYFSAREICAKMKRLI